MRVDGHLHVFLAHSDAYPRAVDELAPAGRSAPVEQLLAEMDAHGVDGAVLVPLGPEDEYVAECLQRYPSRFVGVCVQDAGQAAAAGGEALARSLAKRVGEGGFRAVRMSWLGDLSRPLADSPVYPGLRWMAEQGVVLWFYGPPGQLTLLGRVADELPALTICLNHLGVCPTAIEVDDIGRPRVSLELPPSTLPAVLSLVSKPNVYVMLSGLYAFSQARYPYPDLHDLVSTLVAEFGAERLFWASDFPWIADDPGYDKTLELAAVHLDGASAGELGAVYGGTAQRVFPGAWADR